MHDFSPNFSERPEISPISTTADNPAKTRDCEIKILWNHGYTYYTRGWRNVTKRHLLAWINKFHRNVVESWADREPCQPFHEKFPRIYSSKRSSEIFTDGKTGGRFRSNFYKVLLAVREDRNEYSGKLGREKKLGLILHEAITVRDKNIRFDEIHAFTEKGHGLWNIQERSKTCPGGRFKRTIS